MTEFLLAVLPWIAIGLSLAVVTVNFGRKKTSNKPIQNMSVKPDSRNADKQGSYLSVGMSLGMCLGVVLSSTGLVPLSYGISFGMLIGMMAGILIKKK